MPGMIFLLPFFSGHRAALQGEILNNCPYTHLFKSLPMTQVWPIRELRSQVQWLVQEWAHDPGQANHRTLWGFCQPEVLGETLFSLGSVKSCSYLVIKTVIGRTPTWERHQDRNLSWKMEREFWEHHLNSWSRHSQLQTPTPLSYICQ